MTTAQVLRAMAAGGVSPSDCARGARRAAEVATRASAEKRRGTEEAGPI